jgi:rod shape-determining protein MreC
VYDRKTVRRRRAVLGLLVAGALILLTAYFGESSGGGLHSAQRGVFSIVTPIQDGASRALKPFRDLVNWVGDTIDAKGEVGDLRQERDAFRLQATANAAAANEVVELRKQLDIDVNQGFDQYSPVSARVVGYSPSVWFQQVSINAGAGDGVKAEQPVMDSSGLVGQISDAAPLGSIVRLITSGDMAVGVQIDVMPANGSPIRGFARASVGQPNDLIVTGVNSKRKIPIGSVAVTAGTVNDSTKLTSPYPKGIPVGTVTKVDQPGSDQQEIHLRPAADVKNLQDVQVLTKVNAG